MEDLTQLGWWALFLLLCGLMVLGVPWLVTRFGPARFAVLNEFLATDGALFMLGLYVLALVCLFLLSGSISVLQTLPTPLIIPLAAVAVLVVTVAFLRVGISMQRRGYILFVRKRHAA